MLFFSLLTVLGMFATYRLTWDLARRWTNDDGSFSQLDGPFNLYAYLRDFLQKEFWPEWVHKGSACFYCLSFWAGGVFSLSVLICAQPQGLSKWAVIPLWIMLTYAMSAPTVWWASRNRLMFEQDPDAY